jgi:hypothetical protein
MLTASHNNSKTKSMEPKENLTTTIMLGDPQWNDPEALPAAELLRRSVVLTNDEWLVVSQCIEAFADTYRKNQSLVIATFVTRGQTPEAINEATKMNQMLQRLDQIQATVV